jgi:hypothetical protein
MVCQAHEYSEGAEADDADHDGDCHKPDETTRSPSQCRN